MKILLSFLVTIAVVNPASAKKNVKESSTESEVIWKDPSGKPLQNVPERKSKNGFGGWIILTDDLAWEKQWNSKSTYMPKFTVAKEVKRGKGMELLVAFSNPKLDATGNSVLKYDVAIVKPGGKVDIIHANETCFSGPPPEARGIAMCGAAIQIAMDDSDPLGDWKFEVLLKDTVGGTVLDLATSFKLK